MIVLSPLATWSVIGAVLALVAVAVVVLLRRSPGGTQ